MRLRLNLFVEVVWRLSYKFVVISFLAFFFLCAAQRGTPAFRVLSPRVSKTCM